MGKNALILEAMWKLVDKRVSACQDRAKYQSLIWMLGRTIAAILKGDRRRRAEEAEAELVTLLGSDLPFNWCQDPGWRGGSDPSSVTTSASASSARRLLSPFKIAAIARPNIQIRD